MDNTMIRINSIEVSNIRELTKKEKFLRLNIKSWVISVMSSLILQPHLGLYTLIFFICILTFFYVIEFFDDDIVDIALATLMLSTNTNKYYA